MPDIPFRNVPGFQRGGNSFIPFSMPVAYPRINIHDQDQIWDRGADMAGQVSSTVMEFQQKLQKARDYDNVAEAKRLANTAYTGYLQELHLRNDPENFGKGLEEVNNKVQQQLNDKFGNASDNASRMIKQDVADMYATASLHATGVANQKQVETLQANSLSRVDDYLKVGDLASAKTEIDNGVKLGWYSQAKAKSLLDNATERSSFFRLSDQIRTGDPAQVAADLENKSDKGFFTMYPELEQERRIALINQAKEQQRAQARQFQTNIEKKQYDGTLSVMELDTAVNKGWVSPDTGMKIKKELLDPNKPVPFNPEIFKTMRDAEHTYIQSNQTQADQDAFLKTYTDNYTLLPKENRDHFRNVMEGFNKPEEKFKESVAYKVGAKIVGDAYNDNNLYSDPDGLFNKKSDTATQLVNQARIMDQVNDVFKKNPELQHKPDEVAKIVGGLVKDVQDAKAVEGFSRSYTFRRDPFGKKAAAPALQAGTVDSGYRFKGGNPSDKNNWEKVQ